MQEKKGIKILFDFSFTEFVTTRVIRVLLGIAMVANAIVSVAWIVGGFTKGAGWGILFLILSPIVYLLLMLVSRIYLELIIVAFRIVEHVGAIHEMMAEKKAQSPAKD